MKYVLALFLAFVAGAPAMAFDGVSTIARPGFGGPRYPGNPGYPGNYPGGRPGYPGGPGYGGGPRFYVQWRDVYTGQSISGWQPSGSPTCGSATNCACGGQNYCGTFGAGQQVLYWDLGCFNRPRTLVCDVQNAR